MLRRTILILSLGVITYSITAPTVQAQNLNLCLLTSTWWEGDLIPPGWYSFSAYPGTFVYVIAALSASCHPAPEGPQQCPAHRGMSSEVGQPICLDTGDTYIRDMDASLPGLGGGLNLVRQWNSVWPVHDLTSSGGIFGPNWRSTYEESVFMGLIDNNIKCLKYSRSNGGYWIFGVGNDGSLVVASPATASAVLTGGAGADWLIKFQNGEQRRFSFTTGLLTAIIDRNGNTTQVGYDSNNRLSTVTDAASRHLYFNYPVTTPPSLLVTSVTSDFGLSLSYSYDGQGRLAQVTKADLSTITYTYNSLSQITQVTDSNGKVLESHTYDSVGHGLTSSRANGVDFVTVTPPQ